jgi:hypothetical protein
MGMDCDLANMIWELLRAATLELIELSELSLKLRNLEAVNEFTHP